MNAMLSVLVFMSFIALFIYLMYKIVSKTISTDSGNDALLPYNDKSDAAQSDELKTIKFSQGTGITSVPASGSGSGVLSLSLRDVVIKASYNTAFTGHYVNHDMIRQVIARGCRFLDFQIFVKNGTLVVGYSSTTFDPSYTSMTSLNCLSLAGVCNTIAASAFSDTAPNKTDPMFVQFHLKTAQTDMYDTIGDALYANFSNSMYKSNDGKAIKVTPDTKLGDLKQKIVILVDAPDISTYVSPCRADNTCTPLIDVVNMVTNTATVPIYDESQLIKQMYSPSMSSPYLFRIVQPTLGFYMSTANANAPYLIQNYGAQVVTTAFYINDENFKAYERLFEKSQRAFLSLTDTVGYIKNATGGM